MRTTHSAFALAVAVTVAGLLGTAAVGAEDAWLEAAPETTTTPDPASVQGPGRAVRGGGGPVVVRMRDIPTGDPWALPGIERGHEQGQFEGLGQLNFTAGVPEEDSGAVFGPAPTAAPVPTNSAPSRAPGNIRRNFNGQTWSGWKPPDPVLAVGPKYLVEVVNSGFTIYSKDGGLDRAYTDLETFFQPTLTGLSCAPIDCKVFDPRVFYSGYWNKFVLEALVTDSNHLNSFIVFAISQTSDPLGGWWQYWTMSSVDAWTDYTGMSADPWGVYFTGNDWYWAGGFKSAIILSVRPNVFSGVWNGAWIFQGLTWNESGNPQAFDIQPAVLPFGNPGDSATFFVNTFNSSGNKACLWKLTGDRGNAPTLIRNSVSVSPYADPGNAPQPTGADDVEMFYAGAQNVAYSMRRVYLALNDAGTNRSGFYVSKINVDTLTEERNITYYAGSAYYYYPNVMLYGNDSANPLVAVAMSESDNTTRYPSGSLKLFANFAVDTTGSFWLVASGASSYNVYYQGRNRWGDYMGIARDRTCNTVWSVTEFVSSFNTWRTQITEMLGNTAQSGVCNLIFDDGFERGSTLNWSAHVP